MVKKFSLVSAILALLASGVSAESKSGVFVGVNVGVPITVPTYSDNFGFRHLNDSISKNDFPSSGVGYAIGIDVGYKQMFNDKMGLRYYVDYYFNQSFGSKSGGNIINSIDATINQHLVTANIDFLYNFTSKIGAYVGIGLGYQYFNASYKYVVNSTYSNSLGTGGTASFDKESFALPINVGVHYNLSDNQTIDIGAKLNTDIGDKLDIFSTEFPVSFNIGRNTNLGDISLRSFLIKVGYTYTF